MKNFFSWRFRRMPAKSGSISQTDSSPAAGKGPLSLESKIILLTWAVVAVSLFTTYILISSNINEIVEELMGKNATRIAQIVAKSPAVIETLSGKKQSIEFENWAILLVEITKADIIVYDVAENIRYRSTRSPNATDALNPKDPGLPVPKDRLYVQRNPHGYFLRASSPITDADSNNLGVVVVGIPVDSAAEALDESRFVIIFASYFGLGLGMTGAVFLAKNIKKTLFGLEPFAIARLLEERNATLQSVREGIVAIDNWGRITLINDEALRLLDMEGKRDSLLNQPAEEAIPHSRLLDVLHSQVAEYDQEELLNGVAVVINRVPVNVENRTVAVIATFRDRSEIKRMAEELTGVKTYVEALRSQTHEFMNKLHVILGLVRLEAYDELTAYVTRISSEQDTVADYVAQHIKDPVLAGFWIGKLSRARELGVQLGLSADSFIPRFDNSDFTNDLVTIIGNLVDNAMEALQKNSRRHVEVLLLYDEGYVQIEVQDTGAGIPQELSRTIFAKGFSTKGSDRGFGLALVKKVLERRQGTLTFHSSVQLGTTFQVAIPYEEVNITDDENSDRGR